MRAVLYAVIIGIVLALCSCTVAPVAQQLNEDKLLLTQCRSVISGEKTLDELNRQAMCNEISTNIMSINKALQGEKLPEEKPITVEYIIYLIAQFQQQKVDADNNYLRLQEALQPTTLKAGVK